MISCRASILSDKAEVASGGILSLSRLLIRAVAIETKKAVALFARATWATAAICSNRRSLYLPAARREREKGTKKKTRPSLARIKSRRNLLSAAQGGSRGEVPAAPHKRKAVADRDCSSRAAFMTTMTYHRHKRCPSSSACCLAAASEERSHTQRPSSQSYPLKVNNLHHVVLSHQNPAAALLPFPAAATLEFQPHLTAQM